MTGKWKMLCILATVLLIMGTVNGYAADSEDVATEAANARYGVVRIMVLDSVEHPTFWGLGTGFGVGKPGEDASIFVTNWHVVTLLGEYSAEDMTVLILLDDNTKLTHKRVEVLDENTGETSVKEGIVVSLGAYVECEVLYAEKEFPDVAILKTKSPVAGVTTLPLHRVNEREDIGKTVYAIGYPANADTASITVENDYFVETISGSVPLASFTSGTISRMFLSALMGNTNVIEHSAHINHGNSGGPLILKDGSVIGINTYGYGDNGTEFNDSIYVDYAIDILDDLGLEYELAENRPASRTYIWVIWFAAVAAGTGIVVFVFKRKKAAKTFPAAAGQAVVVAAPPAGENTPEPEDTGLRLQGITGIYAGRRFRLSGEVTLGRDSQCSITYPQGTDGVSRKHCRILVRGSQAVIVDLGSTYGTTVNGKKLEPDQRQPLAVGDRIGIGSTRQEFQITRKGGTV